MTRKKAPARTPVYALAPTDALPSEDNQDAISAPAYLPSTTASLKRRRAVAPTKRSRVFARMKRAKTKEADVTVSGGRGGLHSLSGDESQRAYEASHPRRAN
jgi:hypothetical protein